MAGLIIPDVQRGRLSITKAGAASGLYQTWSVPRSEVWHVYRTYFAVSSGTPAGTVRAFLVEGDKPNTPSFQRVLSFQDATASLPSLETAPLALLGGEQFSLAIVDFVGAPDWTFRLEYLSAVELLPTWA